MIRLFANASFDFLRARNLAYGLTAAFVAVGAVLLLVRGLNESIEFTGGTLLQVHTTAAAVDLGGIRSALEARGIQGSEVQSFGAPDEFVIRARLSADESPTEETTQETAAQVDSALATAFGPGTYEIVRTEAVGPKVGSELRQKALLAVLLSFLATLTYLAFRFEWRFGVAAVAATAHDIIATLAFMAMLNLEVSLVVVAAILTVIGYSLNDTIVTFDRVRENLKKYRRDQLYDILNRSINETLPRTVLTSGTTATAVLALLLFGGAVIEPFAWVMLFGVVTGTFSSMFIASPVLLAIEHHWPGEDARGARPHSAARPAAPVTPRSRRATVDSD